MTTTEKIKTPRELIAHNKATVVAALDMHGITYAYAEYYGEGDSGDVESIWLEKDDQTAMAQQVEFIDFSQYYVFSNNTYGMETEEVTISLEEAIYRLLWQTVDLNHGGWENNDGGRGKLTIDVSEGELRLDHFGKIVDEEHSSYTF